MKDILFNIFLILIMVLSVSFFMGSPEKDLEGYWISEDGIVLELKDKSYKKYYYGNSEIENGVYSANGFLNLGGVDWKYRLYGETLTLSLNGSSIVFYKNPDKVQSIHYLLENTFPC